MVISDGYDLIFGLFQCFLIDVYKLIILFHFNWDTDIALPM